MLTIFTKRGDKKINFLKGDKRINFFRIPRNDIYGPYVELLLNFNGTQGSQNFIDSSKNNLTLTTNGANSASNYIDTTIKKFGSGSVLFPGNLGYIRGNRQFDYSSNFTIEGWVYRTAVGSGGINTIFEAGDISNGVGGIHFYVNSSGTFVFSDRIAAGIEGGTATLNQWVHFAIVRNNGVNTLYINGVSVGTSNQTFSVANNIFSIGGAPNYAYYFQGYIDDFRITIGIPRYLSNFTPPTAELPNPN